MYLDDEKAACVGLNFGSKNYKKGYIGAKSTLIGGRYTDIDEYLAVLGEIFKLGWNSSIKCEICEDDINYFGDEISLCIIGELDDKIIADIESIIKVRNLEYIHFKDKTPKILKVYTPAKQFKRKNLIPVP
jgi:hypothetical protein